MKRLIVCCSLLACWFIAISQRTVNVDKDLSGSSALNYVYTVGGTPFVTAKFARVVEGSPFFNEQVMKGAIILSEGTEYKEVLLRLNLLESQVNYLNEKRIEMVATAPIKEIVLWDTIQNKDHRFVFHSYIASTEIQDKDFYELLQGGGTELYKHHKKRLLETKPYGSATIEQTIQTEVRYYVLHKKQWLRIKKLKDLSALFYNKKPEIQEYISEKNLGDNQADFESVVFYYNSLMAQK